MRRKFIAAVTSGVLALTVMAALPTHAEAVSIWLDLTPVSYTHLTLPTN